MKYHALLLAILASSFEARAQAVPDNDIHVRVNQVGYRPGDQKIAILFSSKALKGNFILTDGSSGKKVLSAKMEASAAPGYGPFKYYYTADFSALRTEGTYNVSLSSSKAKSPQVIINRKAYDSTPGDLLTFMQQLRCGYNPFLDAICHARDGRLMDGPEPDSTYVDVTGGWHDAGDQLKYLITASNATARMLMSYQLFPGSFADTVNALGQPGRNGVADVLDEARWGLDWIHKLHYGAGKLIHQVADDRDHRGWKSAEHDPADYGWGKNSYRVAYFATGKPQGLGKYKSKATGISNLAGRSAAAMALGYLVFRSTDPAYAQRCLAAATDLYAMAKAKEGYQQGNSFGAPYRYNEDTWTDDMEWAATELFKATQNNDYLADAKKYAKATATLSWIERDTSAHYQFYPFLNIAHFELHGVADTETRKALEVYYRDGIEKTLQRSNRYAFANGAPFIWCSNNLLVDLILQIILYERMSGDFQYHGYMLGMRDWLFGRNPWGVSMFTNIPRAGFSAHDVHTSTWALYKMEVPGGLVDGPIYASIYKSLLGLTLTKADSLAPFQNDYVVYHDDIGDYSTNEPTMDGTACAIMLMAYLAAEE